MFTGSLVRAALINSLYKRGVSLSGKSRTELPNSVLVNHLSADISRVEMAAQWFVSCDLSNPLFALIPSYDSIPSGLHLFN
jgi:hypothetical protein